MKKEFIHRGNRLAVLVGTEDLPQLDAGEFSVLGISDFDWNKMLSPWPAEKIFRKGDDFAGRADEMLEYILAQPELTGSWEEIIIAGYSLAGLFALNACTKTDRFTGCASVSGSLWFPGFADYIKDHPVRAQKVYLSLGDREKDTKNPVMKEVEVNTLAVRDLLNAYTDVYFEMNPGGHFQEPELRMKKALEHF